MGRGSRVEGRGGLVALAAVLVGACGLDAGLWHGCEEGLSLLLWLNLNFPSSSA